MNLEDPNNTMQLIDQFRQYETKLYEKIRNPATRQEEVMKIKPQYERLRKAISRCVNDCSTIVELQLKIRDLENKK